MLGPAPILPPLGKAVRETLTPNHATAFYSERRDRTDSSYIALAPVKRGTRYSDLVGADPNVIALFPGGLFFCRENKPGDAATFGSSDRFVVWIWSTDFLAESQSNAEISYAEESLTHPGFARVLTIRREVYEANPTVAVLSPLTALLSVAIGAPGINYTWANGTIGSASVQFVCSGGALVNGIVVVEGSSITSGGAITITGDGTGATATARIQPATALLVSQKKFEFPADSPLSHEFVRKVLIYRTLPGPETSQLGYEPKTGAAMTTYFQDVALPASPRALSGATYNSQYVIDSYVKPESTLVGNLVTVAISMPPTRVEYKSVGFAFPAEFVFIIGWTIPPLCTVPGPYPGETHTLTQQRTASKPGELTTSYSLGLPGVSDTWTVTSPGSADRFFGIGSNTIHNAIYIEETCGAGTQIVEDLPESTPNSYDPTDTLLIKTGAEKWMGNIFEKFELTVTETP